MQIKGAIDRVLMRLVIIHIVLQLLTIRYKIRNEYLPVQIYFFSDKIETDKERTTERLIAVDYKRLLLFIGEIFNTKKSQGIE